MGKRRVLLTTKPFPFQEDAVARIEEFAGRSLLAADPGLGKSLMALKWQFKHNKSWPILIICPASLKWNWKNEVRKHFNADSVILEGTNPRRVEIPKRAKIFIINYDILKPWMEFLLSLNLQLVVIDESQYLRNVKTLRTKKTREVCRPCPHILALSGTPLVNRPAELWPTLNILRPDLYPSFWSYARSHCSPVLTHWGWRFDGATDLQTLHRNLLKQLMVRKKKSEVLKDLPEKSRHVVPLPINNYKEYQKAERDFIVWLAQKSRVKADRARKAQTLTRMGYLKRLAGELKVRQVTEWVENFLDDGDGKIVVFGVHKRVLHPLHEHFKGSVLVDGSVTGRDRQKAVERFEHDYHCRVFLGNIQAAGVGINLQFASTVAFAELSWVPGEHLQGEERCYRIGTKSRVSIYYLIGVGTLEERLCRIIQTKQDVISTVLDGSRSANELSVFDELEQELLKQNWR